MPAVDLLCWVSCAVLLVTAATEDDRLESVPIVAELERLARERGVPLEERHFPEMPALQLEYDFVVVGSGPGGSAVARRLSEEADWTVLLLEKGLEGDLFNQIPSINIYTLLGRQSRYYRVEEERWSCGGLDYGRCDWPSGNGVGGATLINGLLMTRGHPDDYDGWALSGNPGWSYSELLPYFRKVENMSVPALADSPFHGNSGPVGVSYPFRSSLSERFVRAGRELGYDEVDYNNPHTMLGFSAAQISLKNGRRDSAATAYLQPVKDRANLHVLKAALVTKVLVDPRSKTAYGVQYLHKGKEYAVFARKEVVLSAGAFGSPQLLMLSGIGPRQELVSHGIPVIEDLPVGNNLHEHLGTPTLAFLINTNESFPMPKLVAGAPEAFDLWINGKGGPLNNNGPEALGYIRTPLADHKPDIELIFLPITIASDGGYFSRTMRIPKELYDKTWKEINYREGFLIAPMVMYPRSRGCVRLRNKDPKAAPIIEGNFFSERYDVDVLIAGIRATQALVATEAFQEIGSTLYGKPVAGCEGHPFDSDGYWECVIRQVPVQFHHQSGTCRMGPEPGSAVVDPRLRVHGLSRLRVVDASVMPRLPGIHTMLPTYMIGEKAADMIKEDWSAHHYYR